MTGTEAFGSSDVGRVREANEDALYVGDSVFAVADGMGGHVAGEVASATALEPVEALDGRVFPDAPAALTALRTAVISANADVAAKAKDEPSFEGMGTTLTAAMIEGRRIHFAHVGDSRAYLLRGGEFSQLTDDHTLVQHLVDEGQITREEAASHPQRSVITRAIGVNAEVDVDSMSLDLDPGDQVLLCSDGLTGVLSDHDIAVELLAGESGQVTVGRLIDRANEAGGPDNITVVLLRHGDPPVVAASQVGAGQRERGDGKPESAAVAISTRTSASGGDWARNLGRLGSFGTEPGHAPSAAEGPRRPSRWQRFAAGLLALVIVAGLALVGGRWLLSRSYFVGLDGEQVVIYQGVAGDLGPVELSWVAERTPLTRDELAPIYVERLESGITAANLADARRIVESGLGQGDDADDAATGDASPDDAGSDPPTALADTGPT